MKRFIYICVLIVGASLLGSNAIVAQNNATAEAVVKRAISELKKRAYHSSFSLIYYNATTEKEDMQIGKCTMQGRQFKMEMSGIETIFDGKYQWVFVAADNEVTLSQPTADELNESNPMAMVEHYSTTHRINYAESRNKDYEIINFFPKVDTKNVEYFKITLKINKRSFLPRQLVIWQRNGDKISFTWDSMKAIATNGDTFKFIKANYPNVVVNDMR